MKPVFKNLIGIVVGWTIGSIVNTALIELGHVIYPIEGLDTQNMDSLAAIFPTLSAKYYIFPFLGHAIGTLVGALIAGVISFHKMRSALIVGVLFLIGGIVINYLITGPFWFIALDIIFAYIPMAWIAGKITTRKHSNA